MGKKRTPPPADGGGGWLTTYGDTVTLLLAFFVMLYAISQVDAQKFQLLVSGLEDPFKNQSAINGLLETGSGIVGPTEQEDAIPAGVQGVNLLPNESSLEIPEAELLEEAGRILATESDLVEVRNQLVDAFADLGLSTQLGAEIDTRGLVISIATDDVLFETGSPTLHNEAATLIGAITPVLKNFGNEIRVEGHTDTVPLDNNGYTNWNLSSDRALAVLGLIADDQDINPRRLSATGYGEFQPIASNEDAPGRQQNRRVELVIVASIPPQPQEK